MNWTTHGLSNNNDAFLGKHGHYTLISSPPPEEQNKDRQLWPVYCGCMLKWWSLRKNAWCSTCLERFTCLGQGGCLIHTVFPLAREHPLLLMRVTSPAPHRHTDREPAIKCHAGRRRQQGLENARLRPLCLFYDG